MSSLVSIPKGKFSLQACRSSRSLKVKAVSKEVAADGLSMLRELRGLEWSDVEVRTYLSRSVKPVKGFEDVSAERLAKCIDVINGKYTAEDAGVTDRDVNGALTSMRDLWRWKRRGGGVGWEEEGLPLSTIALYELQGVPLPEEGDEAADRRASEARASANDDGPSSILLDGLNLSQEDKLKLSKDIQGAAYAGVQSFLWSNIVLAVAFMALINFLMMKGGQ